MKRNITMKRLVIDWNDSYEIDPACPQKDIALLIDTKIRKIWIKGIEYRGTKKRIKYLSQVIELYLKNKIVSTLELDEINNSKPEVESFQRYFERINEKLVKNGKMPIFISAPEKYFYYLDVSEYFLDYAIV